MATRTQIIDGLQAELAKPDLSDERRQELQHALDFQLEVDDDGVWTPNQQQPVTRHRFAQASGLGSAPRGDHTRVGSDNYREDHCVAAHRKDMPPVPAAASDQQRLELLHANRSFARGWLDAFRVRAENNRTPDGRAADQRCRDEWGQLVAELTKEIDRIRNRVNHAARRGR